ncbi:ATP-grasp fold amidoligase family protein [Providencia rettgeri]|uniref:ATP-grasp fold amidoligase family protein n=1 Tax=Providencia TaxID=586 RepID=UPI00234A18F1|nr:MULTISPECIES: ATP-grasp fold amidoligase family protein [unclassified Providencia]
MKKIFFYFIEKIPLKFRLYVFYFFKFKKPLNLSNPTLYSEKIQKRKFLMKPVYSLLSDKYKVREFVESRIGDEHLINLLAVYNKPEQINFDTLPKSFVIKTNFGSGNQHIEIIKHKESFCNKKIINKFKNAINDKYIGSLLGETQYNKIEKKIIVEEFIKNNNTGIDDFKFHIFNSSDGFLQIDFDRFTNHKRNLYNFSFERLNYDLCYKGGDYELPPTSKLEEMKKIAFKLAEGFDYVRVDLYLVKNQILFGEMTFTPGNGFELFSNPQADKFYGQLWKQYF